MIECVAVLVATSGACLTLGLLFFAVFNRLHVVCVSVFLILFVMHGCKLLAE